jgi:TolB protein
MTNRIRLTFIIAALVVGPAAWPRAQQSQPPTQGQEITTVLPSDNPGQPPRLALPEFIPLTKDAETSAIAHTITQVLWDDLNFEHEFTFVPRDVYSTIPQATSLETVAFDRWRELNPDGLVVGTVEKTGNGIRVVIRLYKVTTKQIAYSREYTGSGANPRAYAHMMADELHKTQRALNGVAQSKLTFSSDRDGLKMTGTVQDRNVKEIYISDYDGERQTRVTVGRTLNAFPRWSPDRRSIVYTSWRHGPPNLFISNITEGTLDELTKGPNENVLGVWSPDGSKICFESNRDGKMQLYVANRDGGGLRRLLTDRFIDSSPTWAPSGNQIAFVSDRSGNPQIYLISSDGVGNPTLLTSESYADKPTWSPAPYNEIAYAARTGPGFDIKVIDVVSRKVTQLTFGEGTNESPAYAPNGRHLAFSSTRSGKTQIFTMTRDGRDLKQITRNGNNQHPDWR